MFSKKKDILIETERLYIKCWELEYAEELHKIMSDDQVHIYTGDTPWTLEGTKEYIQFNRNREISYNPYLPKQPELNGN